MRFYVVTVAVTGLASCVQAITYSCTTIPDAFYVVVAEGNETFYAGASAALGQLVLVESIADAHSFSYDSANTQLEYLNPDSSSVLELFTLSGTPGASALYYETPANIVASGGSEAVVNSVIDDLCNVNITDATNYGTPYVVNDCSGVLYLIDSYTSPATGCVVPDTIFIVDAGPPAPPTTTTTTTETGTLPPYPSASVIKTNWIYDGCVGSSDNFTSFTLVDSSMDQTVENCQDTCLSNGFKFAGLHDTQCYCSNVVGSTVSTSLAIGICDIPCPGDMNENCGGNSLYIVKRDIKQRQYGPTGPLLALYEYVVPGSVSSAVVTTPVVIPSTSMEGSTTVQGISTTTEAGMATTLTTITPAPVGPIETVTLVAGQIYISILIEEYIGICGCEHGLDTLTTTSTLTLTHCGCADEPIYTIPKTVTTTVCSNCGPGGSEATVTLTVPCEGATAVPVVTATVTAGTPWYPAGNGTGNYTIVKPGGTGKPATNGAVGFDGIVSGSSFARGVLFLFAVAFI